MSNKRQRMEGLPSIASNARAAKRRAAEGLVYKDVTFKPGKLGLVCDRGTVIQAPPPGTQSDDNGVEVGWRIELVNGIPPPDDNEQLMNDMKALVKKGKFIKIRFCCGARADRQFENFNDAESSDESECDHRTAGRHRSHGHGRQKRRSRAKRHSPSDSSRLPSIGSDSSHLPSIGNPSHR